MNNLPEGDVLHVDPSEYSLDELYDILAGRSQRLSPVIALSVLRRKDYPEERKIGDLQRILLDAQASSRLRNAAAVELGRLGTPAAQNALRGALERKEEAIERSVELGERELARVHGRSLPRQQGRPELLPSLQAALTRRPGPILAVDPEKARAIERRKTPPTTAERIIGDLNAETPELALATGITYTLRCAGRTLAFVATQEVPEQLRLDEPPVESLVVGVVAARETVETDKWSARYYLLAQAGENGGDVKLRLVTTSGRLVMTGTATVADGQAEFALRSVVGPGNTPAEVRGNYRPGRMQWTEGRSEAQVAQQLTPRRRR